MHLIGHDMVAFAVSSQGDTTHLIRIPEWDFHWQGPYTLQKVQKITAGTTLHAWATYDNTVNNPNNPSNPPKLVVQGEATTDEMMLVYFAYMQYQPGDENIVLDSTLLSPTGTFVPENSPVTKIDLSPNPAHDRLVVDMEIAQRSNLVASLLDLNGRVLKIFADKEDLMPGKYRESPDVNDLPPGLYFVAIQSGNTPVQMVKFVKE
jgi:hypothetical protein